MLREDTPDIVERFEKVSKRIKARWRLLRQGGKIDDEFCGEQGNVLLSVHLLFLSCLYHM